jgi:hypothetical protein
MLRGLLSPEAHLLLLAAQPEFSSDDVTKVVRDPALDWGALARLAQNERATAILWSALRQLPDGAIPAQRASQLAGLARISEFRMQHLEAKLLAALDLLSAHGIDVLLLKGAALAATTYRSFAARPMGDLDLLVKAADAKRAWTLLCHAGWSNTQPAEFAEFYDALHHLPPLDDASGTGLGLEVHSAITPRDGAIQLTAESIWERARVIELKGRRALVPADHHQIVHLAVHFAWSHGFIQSVGWRTFRDLHHIIAGSTIDWDEVLHTAGQARARTCCYWTFRLARSLTNLAVPDRILNALRPPRSTPIIHLLERHFTSSLFASSRAACPSVRLNALLWTAAIAPASSGHGHARPWDQSTAWQQASGVNPQQPIKAGIRAQFSRLGNWMTYLNAVVVPRRLAALTMPLQEPF